VAKRSFRNTAAVVTPRNANPALAPPPRLPGATNLGGHILVDKKNNGRRIWTTLYFLYREFEAMPAVTDSITPQMRTDIMAYVLRQNGFPSGNAELKFDLAAMKLMPLDEPGFVRVFKRQGFYRMEILGRARLRPATKGVRPH